MRLLSVDWDFFFPLPRIEDPAWQLYDWSHQDSGTFWHETVWSLRAGEFLSRGLPLPGTTGVERNFWNRFRFQPGSRLYLSDSHAYGAHEQLRRKPIREVYNFDAHHDCGYNGLGLGNAARAENWLLYWVFNRARVHVVYPKWRGRRDSIEDGQPTVEVPTRIDQGRAYKRPFDIILISRSAGWTPTWVEDQFWSFVSRCPVKNCSFLQNFKRRYWDQGEYRTLGAQMRQVRKQLESNNVKMAGGC